ncbi:MAG: hypothetical protein RR806_00465 [Oscillospiraceae bacterium]
MEMHLIEWLDTILNSEIPENIVALNFNLYDDGDFNWSIELIGTSRFDLKDDDWACDEAFDFGTRENPLSWQQECEWETILNSAVETISDYLIDGKYSALMKTFKGIGVGFVDGEIEIIHCNA